MCEVRPLRERKPGPLTPAMQTLLARIRAADLPVIWDYSRGVRRDTLTLGGEPVSGVTFNGLRIRDLLRRADSGPRWIAYRLAEEPAR